ncbi:MAG: phosphoglycerate dehydrogenase, partial [Mycobacterium sp.]|nr:phosphoglycerate dehydrogenase [Mycobacterium sp.]
AVFADGSVHNVSGTLTEPRLVEKIVNINGRNFDLRAEGHNLIVSYADKPGSLGRIGTLLGNADIDIQAAGLSQDADGPGATVVLRVSAKLSDDLVASIGEAVGATLIEQVDLS